jgi:hypothetical protein
VSVLATVAAAPGGSCVGPILPLFAPFAGEGARGAGGPGSDRAAGSDAPLADGSVAAVGSGSGDGTEEIRWDEWLAETKDPLMGGPDYAALFTAAEQVPIDLFVA